jgi:hypothetical protein
VIDSVPLVLAQGGASGQNALKLASVDRMMQVVDYRDRILEDVGIEKREAVASRRGVPPS